MIKSRKEQKARLENDGSGGVHGGGRGGGNDPIRFVLKIMGLSEKKWARLGICMELYTPSFMHRQFRNPTQCLFLISD